MKYKVGDIVVPVKPEIINPRDKGYMWPEIISPRDEGYIWAEGPNSMDKEVGKVLQIERLFDYRLVTYYVISGWSYREEWLRPATSMEKLEYLLDKSVGGVK